MSEKEQKVRQLVEAAERAFAGGNAGESDYFLGQAQGEAPGHPLVLNQTGLRELRQGRSAAARQLFEQATAADPRYIAAYINLATALGDLGQAQDELNALDQALRIDPRHLMALLQKGAVLESMGQTRNAAGIYHDALLSVPSGTKLPRFLAPRIEHAQAAVKKNMAELGTHIEARLAATRARFEPAAQDRFDHCIDAALGRRRIHTSQPTFLHIPKLPALEFYPREMFPWLEELEAATDDIRKEFRAARTEDEQGFNAHCNYGDSQPLDQFAVLNQSNRCSNHYLWHDGRPVAEHQVRCPKTTALLDRIPRLDVPGAGPQAYFSMLKPKATIPGHMGVTNARLIVHLPLMIPPQCTFRVGSDVRPWQPGTAWVFDDTIEHEARNDSDEERAILVFDIWNPFLTEAERELFRVANTALREFSDEAYGRNRWDN